MQGVPSRERLRCGTGSAAAVKPYYEHAGMLCYTGPHEDMSMWVRKGCIRENSFRGPAPFCYGPQPPGSEEDRRPLQGHRTGTTKCMEDETPPLAYWNEASGLSWIHPSQGATRKGGVEEGAHRCYRAYSWSPPAVIGACTSHQWGSRRQSVRESIPLSRPKSPQQYPPLRDDRLSSTSQRRHDLIQGRSL